MIRDAERLGCGGGAGHGDTGEPRAHKLKEQYKQGHTTHFQNDGT